MAGAGSWTVSCEAVLLGFRAVCVATLRFCAVVRAIAHRRMSAAAAAVGTVAAGAELEWPSVRPTTVV